MGNSIVKLIERTLDRRAFLGKLTAMAGALVGGIFGASDAAYGCNFTGCCGLCRVTTSTCTSNLCTVQGGNCYWTWMCPYPLGCKIFSCSECLLTLPSGCPDLQCVSSNNLCRACPPDVICSKAQVIHSNTPPGCVPGD